jgi:hypothetical protein
VAGTLSGQRSVAQAIREWEESDCWVSKEAAAFDRPQQSYSPAEAITLDVLDMEAMQLQHEIVLLRRRGVTKTLATPARATSEGGSRLAGRRQFLHPLGLGKCSDFFLVNLGDQLFALAGSGSTREMGTGDCLVTEWSESRHPTILASTTKRSRVASYAIPQASERSFLARFGDARRVQQRAILELRRGSRCDDSTGLILTTSRSASTEAFGVRHSSQQLAEEALLPPLRYRAACGSRGNYDRSQFANLL